MKLNRPPRHSSSAMPNALFTRVRQSRISDLRYFPTRVVGSPCASSNSHVMTEIVVSYARLPRVCDLH